MSKRLVLENEFAQLWFHPEAGVVHSELRKFVWGQTYHQLMNDGLDLLVCEGACKWLSENSQNKVYSREDTEWAMNVFMPRAAKNGLKYWAIVPPENVIGQMNLERIASVSAPSGVEARLFSDVPAGLTWLEGIVPTARRPEINHRG